MSASGAPQATPAVHTPDALTERLTLVERDRSHPPMKVRDAASLIVLDRSEPTPKVLMGRRSMRHKFFPGRFVFPGGRVDPTDARVPAAPYTPQTAAKLTAMLPARYGPARAHALGIAALREAYEETGLIIGRPGAAQSPRGPAWRAFADAGLGLDLAPLHFLLRAVTPPGRPRRFDTRFLVVDRTHVAATDPTVIGDDAELEAIHWVPLPDAKALALPTITLTVLDVLETELAKPGGLTPGAAVPFFRWRGRGFVRDLL